MKPHKQRSAITPALRINNLLMTDQDRAMLARRQSGETLKAVAAEFAVNAETVRRAEWRGRMNAEGREMLADDPEGLYGLCHVGELDWGAAHILRCHHYHHDGPELTRLSDVAAVGRTYVAALAGLGPKRMVELDSLLERFGLAWNPKPQELRLRHREPVQTGPNATDLIATIQSLRARVAYLEGWGSQDKPDAPADLETSGNLICLPGVKLTDVRSGRGDDPGPAAA